MNTVRPPSLSGCAYAKLNLYLHVTGRRADGYHMLDSLVVFADIADRLEISAQDHLSLTVGGRFADGAGPVDQNLVMRAALALQAEAGCRLGAAIQLEKNIPSGAGLGGGSADAAAVLNLLNRFWKLNLDPAVLAGIGLKLGADVPVCIQSVPTVMQGIGEILRPAPSVAPMDLVLVHPGVGLPTPMVFKALAGRFSGPADPAHSNLSDPLKLVEAISRCRNDLQSPAVELMPEIGAILYELETAPGCLTARMSGSGSACFGLFQTAADADRAASALQRKPDRWVRTGHLLGQA